MGTLVCCATPHRQPQQRAPFVSQPPGIFLAEIIHHSPDRRVQALVLCPGVSATFTLISPVTHPFHATERDLQSVSLHVTFPPASCSGDFLEKIPRNAELLPKHFSCGDCKCFRTQAVPCQQHGTENPSLLCKLGTAGGLAMVWEEGWPCPPPPSPSAATGTHPTGYGEPKACSSRAAQPGSCSGLFLL